MKGKSLVREQIGVSMNSHGWPLLRLADLPPAFARDTLVTPYFFCSDVPLRPFGKYIVEGVVGVVHRGFEQRWVENPLREPKEPGFGVALHLANLRELGSKVYIACEGPVERQVDALCATIGAILEQLPHDEQQLVAAFRKGELYGIPLESFAGYSHRKKFQAFREFVNLLETAANR